MNDRMNLSKEQLKAFESPIRATVINALRAHGELTVRDLSRIMGREADGLYYHVRHLIALGLVQIQQVRSAETRPEAVYELTAKEFYMDDHTGHPENAWSVFRSAKNVQKLALNHYQSALESGEDEAIESIRFGFSSGRMSKENLEILKRDLIEIGRRVLASNEPDGQPVLLTTL
ncbi:MAG: helix-turn-helix domain-containing protein, partial [Armatimonadota bacterium]